MKARSCFSSSSGSGPSEPRRFEMASSMIRSASWSRRFHGSDITDSARFVDAASGLNQSALCEGIDRFPRYHIRTDDEQEPRLGTQAAHSLLARKGNFLARPAHLILWHQVRQLQPKGADDLLHVASSETVQQNRYVVTSRNSQARSAIVMV